MTKHVFVDVNGLNGGLAYGMVQAGLPMAYRTGYLTLGQHIVNANRNLWGGGWKDELEPMATSDDWMAWPMPRKADVIVGVPPCAGFSIMTGRGNSRSRTLTARADHPINACMISTVRYAARHAPRVVMFESVAAAYTKGRDLMQSLRADLERISGKEYTLTHWLHDGITMGAPTSRLRYMFVACRGKRPFAVEPVESYAPRVGAGTSTKDAIGDLEGLALRPGDQRIVNKRGGGKWARERRRADGRVDGHWLEGGAWQRRVAATLFELDKVGGTWVEGEHMDRVLRRLYDGGKPERVGQLKQAMLSEEMADRMIERDFGFGTFPIRREAYELPCKLITGGGSVFHVHPVEQRCLTFRELARIQGWPDELRIDFDTSVYGKEKLPAVWGKAVGCRVAEHAGLQVVEWLANDVAGKTVGEKVGDREWLIDELAPARRLRSDAAKYRRALRATAGVD